MFKIRQAKSKLKGLLSHNTIHFFLSFWKVLLSVQLSRYIVYLADYFPVQAHSHQQQRVTTKVSFLSSGWVFKCSDKCSSVMATSRSNILFTSLPEEGA